MLKRVSLILLVAIPAWLPALGAEPSMAMKDFDKLEQRYEADMKRALEPIQKRFITDLQTLQKRATQAGDLETAIKTKDRLAKLGAVDPLSITPGEKPAYGSIEGMMAVIPAEVVLNQKDLKGVEAQKATEALRSNILGKRVQLRLVVKAVEPKATFGSEMRIVSELGRVKFKENTLPYGVWAYFLKAQAGALAKVRPGQTVNVTGTVARCDFGLPEEDAELIIDLKECAIVP